VGVLQPRIQLRKDSRKLIDDAKAVNREVVMVNLRLNRPHGAAAPEREKQRSSPQLTDDQGSQKKK
jgi:hypothetical protein